MSTSGKPKDNNRCFLAFSVMKLEGEGVTELQPGDHVLPVFTGECKECAHCKSKESNMCDLLMINTDRGTMINDGQSRFPKDGKPIYHFLGFGATVNVAKPKKGSSIAIFGLGAVGLAAAEGARVSGCSRI
ncbi:alcohol dehydrogenase 3-like isoform X2 [Malus sylvestris]|uniref:alcohol dehydrogenase 3-like isoform X2 n=1 Tax=Malus sylvestris TaxID=3752 RepID=UPI0021ABBD54|nr:alcohol dehydrogenase 3-like isoform X2 [Malus sylvestris]